MSAVRIPWKDHEGWSIVARSGLGLAYVHDRTGEIYLDRRDAEEYFKRMNDSKRGKPAAAAGAEGEAEEPAAGGEGRAGKRRPPGGSSGRGPTLSSFQQISSLTCGEPSRSTKRSPWRTCRSVIECEQCTSS